MVSVFMAIAQWLHAECIHGYCSGFILSVFMAIAQWLHAECIHGY